MPWFSYARDQFLKRNDKRFLIEKDSSLLCSTKQTKMQHTTIATHAHIDGNGWIIQHDGQKGEDTITHEGEEMAPAGEPKCSQTIGNENSNTLQEQALNALWADTLLHGASGRDNVNPIGRGTARDLRHQGMRHRGNKPATMCEAGCDKAAPGESRELEKENGNEEASSMEEDVHNDAAFEAYLEEQEWQELARRTNRDEVRRHYMREEASFNEMLDFMFHAPPTTCYPKTNTYWQRPKSILEKRLQQLRITVEPREEKEAKESQALAVSVPSDRIGNNLLLSKWNKSRASASFARRLLILIRSHLRKKGL